MSENEDIRWKQRFDNFLKTLLRLKDAVELKQQRALTPLEQQGFIKAFEFTHELAWNVIKDYALYQGQSQIMGSRDATRYAFTFDIVANGDDWMEMIKSRNKAVHAYDEVMAKAFKDNTNIESVYLYGSRAKGNYRRGSDIDLTIKNSRIEY